MIDNFPEGKLIISWIIAWIFAIVSGQVESGILDVIIKILTIVSLLLAISYTIWKWVKRVEINSRNNNTKKHNKQ